MPIKKLHSQAIRFNGFTDGIVVPTGAFRESGVDLYAASHSEKTGGTNKVPSYNSDDPKIGRRHIPNEGNGLNNIIGPFTIEAFVIPDKGGIIVSKENCYTLEIGSPLAPKSAVFTVFTRSTSGAKDAVNVATSFNFPALNNPYSTLVDSQGSAEGVYQFNPLINGEQGLKPHDLDLPFQPLLYLNAQFTGKDLRLHINGDLVAKSDFGGEERTIQASSSDLFIGGRGGEFRGVIESVRISRGVVAPKLQPFTKQENTMGLWDFEDEDDIPDLFFANHKSPAQAEYAGRDGVGQSDGKMSHPMVCIGYDFTNVVVGGNITTPLSLTAGYDYATFKIRDFGGNKPTSLEMLASHILSIAIDELPLQPWWNNGTGVLDIGAHVTKARYHADGLPVSNLNAIVNASGTDPNTGVPVSSYDYEDLAQDPAGGVSLDPMANPIERIRIIALDFNANAIVVQNSMLKNEDGVADAKSQGFIFAHPDNTPIWFTLGNGDLMIDPGNDLRPAGQMTRARFTQGQRFKDKSGFGNAAYFVNTHSRNTNEMKNRLQSVGGLTQNTNYPPMSPSLLLWLDADDPATMLNQQLQPLVSLRDNNEYPVWWTSKAPAAPDYHFYGGNKVGNAWRWIKNNPKVNSRGGLQAAGIGEQEGATEIDPGLEQAGNIEANLIPLTPTTTEKSMWVNGEGAFQQPGRVPGFDSVNGPAPLIFAAAHNTAIGGVATNNGDFTFYYVLTPQYASGVLHLLKNIANTPDFQLDNGSGVPSVAYSNITVALHQDGKPTAGQPCLVAITVNGTENGSYKMWAKGSGAGATHSQALSGTPNANLSFLNTTVGTGGLELFGFLTHTPASGGGGGGGGGGDPPKQEDPEGGGGEGLPFVPEGPGGGIGGIDPLEPGNPGGGIANPFEPEEPEEPEGGGGGGGGGGGNFVPESNAATATAPPGFIVHEVLIYAGSHGSSMADVRQYVEDKWGI